MLHWALDDLFFKSDWKPPLAWRVIVSRPLLLPSLLLPATRTSPAFCSLSAPGELPPQDFRSYNFLVQMPIPVIHMTFSLATLSSCTDAIRSVGSFPSISTSPFYLLSLTLAISFLTFLFCIYNWSRLRCLWLKLHYFSITKNKNNCCRLHRLTVTLWFERFWNVKNCRSLIWCTKTFLLFVFLSYQNTDFTYVCIFICLANCFFLFST